MIHSPKNFSTPNSLNKAIKNICDILRRSNCTGALQYIPELTWILFLRLLDYQEMCQEVEQNLEKKFTPILESPYRWRDWASPNGWKRIELQMTPAGAFFGFVNDALLPYLKNLKYSPNATHFQKVISEIIFSVEKVRVDREKNLLEVLDKVDQIRPDQIDQTHIFPISQVYEGLLLKMGEKSNDGGQFFTPREIVRLMVSVIAPQWGETVYDPCCGTGGFLVQTYEFILKSLGKQLTDEQLKILKNETLYGREKENLIYPIALANLLLHGIEQPHLWHGNTLANTPIYDGLFANAPDRFDVILTNPPFGGKEGKEVQNYFDFPTSSTQILFLQHIIDSLKPGGRCAIILDEGVLFRQNETAFIKTKQRLLRECNLWCIVSLPCGVFVNAGTHLKTNILFFTKGEATQEIWYYDLSHIKVTQKNPMTWEQFDDFFRLLPAKENSAHSWIISHQVIEERGYDLKAVNPYINTSSPTRTREELLSLIEAKNHEFIEALAFFKK